MSTQTPDALRDATITAFADCEKCYSVIEQRGNAEMRCLWQRLAPHGIGSGFHGFKLANGRSAGLFSYLEAGHTQPIYSHRRWDKKISPNQNRCDQKKAAYGQRYFVSNAPYQKYRCGERIGSYQNSQCVSGARVSSEDSPHYNHGTSCALVNSIANMVGCHVGFPSVVSRRGNAINSTISLAIKDDWAFGRCPDSIVLNCYERAAA